MRCWLCGAEPLEVHSVVGMESPNPVIIFVRWPENGDHEHADRPPTPDELIESGHVALLNIQAEWAR